jgi:ribonuclease R
MAKNKKKRVNEQKRSKTTKQARKDILHFLRTKPNKGFNHKQIAGGIDLRGQISHDAVKEILEALADDQQVDRVGRGQYSVVSKVKTLTGKIDVTRDGFGFVIVDDSESVKDIFIAPAKMGKALNGDTVSIRILNRGGRDHRPEGEVLEVIERGQEHYIGKIEILDNTAFFIADDPKIGRDFFISRDALGGANDGDKVLIKIHDWTRQNPEGAVIRVLGPAGENETEMHAILFQFGFKPEFPKEVENEAAGISGKMTAAEIKKRRDMREVTTFTVDPPDAKDFDDALSIQFLDGGMIEVGVHIADVSFYVRPNTALDKEAYDRATSVYLVDRTVPMLPERLSNELCSLRPNEDKYTFSAIFELDMKGHIHKEWFGRTVIHSNHRFAYEEAQAVMDAGEGEYLKELNTLNQIAKIFQKKRFEKGSIKFEDDEVKFELDDAGKPIRVYRKVRKDAHKMIEDWMLLANRRVSEFVYKKRKGNALPFVYRIHDTPNDEKLLNLQQFAGNLGYKLELESPGEISQSLNRLMQAVEGKPEQSLIQTVAIRTMAKAIYSTDNIGHYGLGFQYYSHFTSPIRRYPDLMVHRMLGQYLEGDYSGNVNTLEAAARHCTNRERRAVEAERASIKYKQVEFLEGKIGEEFEGIISGVTSWGLYVELIENKCEGMIGLHSMDDDYYEVDTDNYCVRGRSSNVRISLGDKVMVEVKGTSAKSRTIDFSLIEVLETAVKEDPATARAARKSSGGGRRVPKKKSRNPGFGKQKNKKKRR